MAGHRMEVRVAAGESVLFVGIVHGDLSCWLFGRFEDWVVGVLLRVVLF